MKCSEGMCEYIYNISVAVTNECKTGKLFSMYTFNKFARSLEDACLCKGDFAAFRSPCIGESTRFRIEKGWYDLETHIGFFEEPTAKIFFARKPHVTVSLLFYVWLYVFEGICAN
jgi:hypothetical protein